MRAPLVIATLTSVLGAPACVVREIHHYPAQVHCDVLPGDVSATAADSEPAPIVVASAPPALPDDLGPQVAAPAYGCWYWAEGYWTWTGNEWTWMAGSYAPCIDGLVWVYPSYQEVDGGGCWYVPPHFRHRGPRERGYTVHPGPTRISRDHRVGPARAEDVGLAKHPGFHPRGGVIRDHRSDPPVVGEVPDRPWRDVDRASAAAAATPPAQPGGSRPPAGPGPGLGYGPSVIRSDDPPAIGNRGPSGPVLVPSGPGPHRAAASPSPSQPPRYTPTSPAEPTRSAPPSSDPPRAFSPRPEPTRSAPPRYEPPRSAPPRYEPPRSEPSRSAPSPSRSEPSRGAPSPSRSEPSRSAPSPSRSEPSRSAPSPSRSEPSRGAPSPSRSEPSRSAPSPSRSEPSRSAPSPSRSEPSRSGSDRGSNDRRR